MATYYIQVSSAWEGSRWWTAHKTEDKALAEYLAEGLEIGVHEYGQDNPGLPGRRYARAISKTKLVREDGRAALLRAEQDLAESWDDAPKRGRGITARPQFEPTTIAADVQSLLDLYGEEKREKAEQGSVDFLLRDMPGDLHAAVKHAAAAEDISMTEWIILTCRSALPEKQK